jgi:hypothetical protein
MGPTGNGNLYGAYQSIFGRHIEFSRELGGGFSLRKKPLNGRAPVYTNSENARSCIDSDFALC